MKQLLLGLKELTLNQLHFFRKRDIVIYAFKQIEGALTNLEIHLFNKFIYIIFNEKLKSFLYVKKQTPLNDIYIINEIKNTLTIKNSH